MIVEECRALRLKSSSDPPDTCRADRAHVDGDEAGTRGLRDSFRALIDGFDIGNVRHHGNHDIGSFGDGARGCGHRRANSFRQPLGLGSRPVINRERKSGLRQVAGHAFAHQAKSNESGACKH
jgi:hypothetical protein